MKNLPVLRKILLSFGLVILMLAIILTVSLVTSIRRTNDLTRANLLSDMLNTANDTLDSFNESRVAAEVALTALDAETAYTNFFSGMDKAITYTKELDDYSDQLGGYEAATTTEIRTRMEDIVVTMQAIRANDDGMGAELAAMGTCADELSASAAQLYALVSGLTREVLATGELTPAQWMGGTVDPIQALNVEIGIFRLEADALTIGLDSSAAPGLSARLDGLEATVAGLVKEMRVDEGVAAANTILADITEYRETMARFLDVMTESEEYIASMYTDMDEILTLVAGGVDKISNDTNTILEASMAESESSTLIMLIACVLAIVLSFFSAFYLARLITRPLAKMQKALVQVGTTGNLQFSDEVKQDIQREAEAKDEIGQSLAAFVGMMERLIYVGDRLTDIAGGDLTAEISLLSGEDTMGTALKTMAESLNEMFAEIKSVADQVSTGATEIAQGAQTLAQGSTEQASTVEQISASVNEINEQATTSSETAGSAAHHGEEISRIAQQGSGKMEQMMDAVMQINEASQAIGQVIGVIDNIAFQTNILALNAAVEAAHAGQHGKGFAVVAEEVGNLANKSADAAKETAALVSANIEKAELGLSISKDTAESLTKIIEGIQNTSQSLQTLADQSASSKAATTQVTLAVDQVAQVVQQNSATSEESAAASEEMSSQAQVLQQLIARFRLRETDAYALPSQARAPVGLPPVQQSVGGISQPSGEVIF